jgi:hypothetical protein
MGGGRHGIHDLLVERDAPTPARAWLGPGAGRRSPCRDPAAAPFGRKLNQEPGSSLVGPSSAQGRPAEAPTPRKVRFATGPGFPLGPFHSPGRGGFQRGTNTSLPAAAASNKAGNRSISSGSATNPRTGPPFRNDSVASNRARTTSPACRRVAGGMTAKRARISERNRRLASATGSLMVRSGEDERHRVGSATVRRVPGSFSSCPWVVGW